MKIILKQFIKTDTNQKFFIGLVEEKQKLLHELTHEQSELTAAYKPFIEKNNEEENESDKKEKNELDEENLDIKNEFEERNEYKNTQEEEIVIPTTVKQVMGKIPYNEVG